MAEMTEIYICPACKEAYASKSEAMDCLREHKVKAQIYICPACKEAYESEYEAEDCLRSHSIEEEMGWACDCGMAFINEAAWRYHSRTCPYVKPSCDTCNNYDNGRRHAPCERDVFSEDMSPCDDYRKVKVAP